MILFRWLINAMALIAVTYLVHGIHVSGFWTALWVALVLGLLNAVVRPILIFLTLPITLLTLGLFTFVINAAILLFVGTVTRGFTIDNFSSAFLAAVLLWAIGWLTSVVLKR